MKKVIFENFTLRVSIIYLDNFIYAFLTLFLLIHDILAQSDTFKSNLSELKNKASSAIHCFCLFFVVCLVFKILPSFKHSSFKRGRV